ncbi:MAG TPA: tetratricopeptide repeat protein [Candidatus Polarisedimenticolaceae bacterium]|nr:tetratricopeptide repeat protein [Candidatus Polarisedimenticolaceae bacterium]
MRRAALAVVVGALVTTAVGAASITVDYPSPNSIFPPEMEAPTFLWHDPTPDVDHWEVSIGFDGESKPVLRVEAAGDPPAPGEIDERCVAVTNEIHRPTDYQASARAWKPAPEIWATIRSAAGGRSVHVGFSGRRADGGEAGSRGHVELTISPDPVGAPIFYRDVPLMPSAGADGVIKPVDQSALPLIGWRLRDLSRPESRLLLESMPTCANCHSFSSDGRTLAMDIDGPQGDKGAYAVVDIEPETVIRDEDVISWNRFDDKPRGFNTLGFMARVSPDGSRVVATVNEALYVRNFWDYRFSQVFFPTRGILAWYDRTTGGIRALPGADDPDYVHCNAVWTPDGEELIFARSPARDPYEPGRPPATYAGDPNETQIRYDLYRMPFDDGRGGAPTPIAGASANGSSNSFPKVSPDGRWLVWTRSDNGLLMRPDSRLWIVALDGGQPRELESNLTTMNSWHSFSPNGRWLVFSSKANTPYTQMFLTHLDDNGHASPAILVENSTAANRAVNLPEFVHTDYESFHSIAVPAVDHYAHFHRGNELARAGRYDEAVAAYREALEGEQQDWRINDWRIHDSLSKILTQIGQRELALHHVRRSLELNPSNLEMRTNLGYLLAERGEPRQALEQFDLALRLAPAEAQNWYNRATVRMQLGDDAGAISDYTEAIERNPRHARALIARGILLEAAGRTGEALADFDRTVGLDPNNPTALFLRGRIRAARGERLAALADFETALAVAPPDWTDRPRVERALERLRSGPPGGE